jgi:ATP-dependent Zn protease
VVALRATRVRGAQVAMAGRVGEMAVLGAANVTTAGAPDLTLANQLARTMVFRCGWSPAVGPVTLEDDRGGMLGVKKAPLLGDMTPDMAAAALREMQRALRAAEAKAYWGLVNNWELLHAMADALLEADYYTLTLCAPVPHARACLHSAGIPRGHATARAG